MTCEKWKLLSQRQLTAVTSHESVISSNEDQIGTKSNSQNTAYFSNYDIWKPSKVLSSSLVLPNLSSRREGYATTSRYSVLALSLSGEEVRSGSSRKAQLLTANRSCLRTLFTAKTPPPPSTAPLQRTVELRLLTLSSAPYSHSSWTPSTCHSSLKHLHDSGNMLPPY